MVKLENHYFQFFKKKKILIFFWLIITFLIIKKLKNIMIFSIYVYICNLKVFEIREGEGKLKKRYLLKDYGASSKFCPKIMSTFASKITSKNRLSLHTTFTQEVLLFMEKTLSFEYSIIFHLFISIMKKSTP